jgi:hypothetical protein
MGCYPYLGVLAGFDIKKSSGARPAESETGFEIDVRGVWTGFQLIPPWERQSQISFAPLFFIFNAS